MLKTSALDNRILKLLAASIALVIGGLIYIIYRSESLIMFSWFDNLGLSNNISFLRELYSANSIYSWVKYNMPAALWLFAYLFVIDAIWEKRMTSPMYKAFFWFMPVIAVLSEVLQLINLLPGTFDIFDVCSYIVAVVIYFILNFFE